MNEQINSLENHYILCGVGRTGFHIIERFREIEIPYIVVEHDMKVIYRLQEAFGVNQIRYVFGDATEDEILEQAGVTQAKGLITTFDDDRENLFVTLTARSLNPDLHIVSRINDERFNREKFEKAGANKIISTNIIGGLRMASEMIRPAVVDFLDQMVQASDENKHLRFTELPLTDIQIPALKKLIEANSRHGEQVYDLRITDIGRFTGLLVVAIKTHDVAHPDHDNNNDDDDETLQRKRYHFTPRGDQKLHHDDILVVIGTQDKLNEVLGE